MYEITVLLTQITCIHSSAEGGHDDVYLELCPNGDLSKGRTYFHNNPIKMKGVTSDDCVRFLDISVNATYLDSLLLRVWDKDSGSNDDDLLAEIWLSRGVPLEGSRGAKQTTGQKQAEYEVSWRVLDKPIPTLRVLGLRCEKSSAGCNAEQVQEIFDHAATITDIASGVFGRVKTPRAQLISPPSPLSSTRTMPAPRARRHFPFRIGARRSRPTRPTTGDGVSWVLIRRRQTSSANSTSPAERWDR